MKIPMLTGFEWLPRCFLQVTRDVTTARKRLGGKRRDNNYKTGIIMKIAYKKSQEFPFQKICTREAVI